MVTALECAEYLEELRKQVCSRCVERPPEGPPCLPLGKECGVETHLPELIEAVRHVHSGLMEPYQQQTRCEICEHCKLLHSDVCPCPMDYLMPLIVDAIETVDRRHGIQVGLTPKD
jgi:hypothetical protein